MFQVFLIIFWATIRLQSRGHVVYDPSVGGADSSPWQGSQGRWLAALFSLPPLLRGGGAGAKRMARWGRVSFNNSGSDPSVGDPSGSQANHLPLTGEAMTIPLAGEPTTQSMRLFTAASIYSHTPRKFLFTSLFGMRRTVKP